MLPIPAEEEAVLREWNEVDPPDLLEKRRENLIEGKQGNRNMFVDRPDLVRRISRF